MSDLDRLPGWEIVGNGLNDLREQNYSSLNAMLVILCSPKLHSLGLTIPDYPLNLLKTINIELYQYLDHIHGDAAHYKYNSLVQRVISFENAFLLFRRYQKKT